MSNPPSQKDGAGETDGVESGMGALPPVDVDVAIEAQDGANVRELGEEEAEQQYGQHMDTMEGDAPSRGSGEGQSQGDAQSQETRAAPTNEQVEAYLGELQAKSVALAGELEAAMIGVEEVTNILQRFLKEVQTPILQHCDPEKSQCTREQVIQMRLFAAEHIVPPLLVSLTRLTTRMDENLQEQLNEHIVQPWISLLVERLRCSPAAFSAGQADEVARQREMEFMGFLASLFDLRGGILRKSLQHHHHHYGQTFSSETDRYQMECYRDSDSRGMSGSTSEDDEGEGETLGSTDGKVLLMSAEDMYRIQNEKEMENFEVSPADVESISYGDRVDAREESASVAEGESGADGDPGDNPARKYRFACLRPTRSIGYRDEPSIAFMENVELFGVCGGFACLAHLTEVVTTLQQLAAVLRLVRRMDTVIRNRVKGGLLQKIMARARVIVESLTNENLRDMDHDEGDAMFDQLCELTFELQIEKLTKAAHLLRLEYLLCCYRSSLISLRLRGLKKIRAWIDDCESFRNNPGQRHKFQHTQHRIVDCRRLAEWLVQKRILYETYGPNIHVEVIKREAIQFPLFLGVEKLLTKADCDMVLSSFRGKHESFRYHVLQTIHGLPRCIGAELTDYMWQQIEKIPVSEYDEIMLVFVRDFTHCAITHVARAEAGSDPPIYGCSLLWRLSLDESEAGVEVAAMALNLLCGILQTAEVTRTNAREDFLGECVNNLKVHKNVPQSLQLLSSIVAAFDQVDAKKGNFENVVASRRQLEAMRQVLPLFTDDVRHFQDQLIQARSEEKSSGDLMANRDDSSAQLQMSASFQSSMDLAGMESAAVQPAWERKVCGNKNSTVMAQVVARLNFLDAYAGRNSGLEVPVELVFQVWDAFVRDAVTTPQQEHTLMWFRTASTARSMGVHLNPECCAALFEKRACALAAESVTRFSFGFFKTFFLHVNSHSQAISRSPLNEESYLVVKPDSLLGLERLWEFVFCAENEWVGTQAMELLLKMEKSLTAELASVVGDRRRQFLGRCAKELFVDVNALQSSEMTPAAATVVVGNDAMDTDAGTAVAPAVDAETSRPVVYLRVLRALKLMSQFCDEFESGRVNTGDKDGGNGATSNARVVSFASAGTGGNIATGVSGGSRDGVSFPIKLRPTKIPEKVVMVTRQTTVGQVRQLAAQHFAFDVSRIRLVACGKEWKDDHHSLGALGIAPDVCVLVQEVSIAAARFQTVGACLQTSLPENLPSKILAEYSKPLFALLDAPPMRSDGAESEHDIAHLAWGVLNRLPPNTDVLASLAQVGGEGGTAAALEVWRKLLDAGSNLRLLYSLQIIDRLLQEGTGGLGLVADNTMGSTTTASEDSGSDENGTKSMREKREQDFADENGLGALAWRDLFVSRGGVAYLINVFCQIGGLFGVAQEGYVRQCVAVLLRIILRCVSETTQVQVPVTVNAKLSIEKFFLVDMALPENRNDLSSVATPATESDMVSKLVSVLWSIVKTATGEDDAQYEKWDAMAENANLENGVASGGGELAAASATLGNDSASQNNEIGPQLPPAKGFTASGSDSAPATPVRATEVHPAVPPLQIGSAGSGSSDTVCALDSSTAITAGQQQSIGPELRAAVAVASAPTVVENTAVEIYVGDKLVRTVGAGLMLGEISFLDASTGASASIRASNMEVELMLLPREFVLETLEDQVELKAKFYGYLSRLMINRMQS